MKFLLILFLLYLGARFTFRVLLPGYISKKLKNFEEQVREQQRQQEPIVPEGQTKVIMDDDNPNGQDVTGSVSNKSEEDYIDFEDVD